MATESDLEGRIRELEAVNRGLRREMREKVRLAASVLMKERRRYQSQLAALRQEMESLKEERGGNVLDA